MRQALLGLLIVVAGVSGAGARDLWGDGGLVILSDENTEVMARVERIHPSNRVAVAVDIEPVMAAEETPAESEEVVVVAEEPAALTRPITAPSIPDDVELYGDAPSTDEMVQADDNNDTPVDDAYDPYAEEEPAEQEESHGVVMLGDFLEVDPKAPGGLVGEDGEIDMASLPREPDPSLAPRPGQTSRSGFQSFDSRAFGGNFAGVGPADGMRLDLETVGMDVTGWFVDSAGQMFEVRGEFVTLEGQAQAAVLSEGSMVGFLDMQLTNLGLAALFVPVTDGAANPHAARQYDFLRALSDEAESGLSTSRSARESLLNADPEDQMNRGPLRLQFPGDDDYN